MPGPIGVQVPAPLATQSRRVAYDKELRMKSSLESIYTTLKGQYNTEKKTIPNGIYMTISDKALSDSWRARITMKYPLREGGVFGDDFAVGHEEQAETKACEIYRNNCRKVVAVPGYGTTKLDADYLGLFEKHVDDLSVWNKDQEDYEIHQALLETYGETLRYGDTQAVCTPNWNPNVFIAGQQAYGTLPQDYSPVANTYTANIISAITALGAGGPTILDQLALSNISNYALKKRLDRLDIPGIPGGKGYVLTISELQAMYMGDPAWAAKNLGNLFISKTSLNEKVMNWPGVIGAYKDLLIVVDVRAATLKRPGNGNTLVAGYVKPGDNDDRGRGAATTYDIAVVHGKGALWKWEPEPLYSIEQLDDYGKIKGVGTACVRGIGIPIYRPDIGAAQASASASIEQLSSAVVICGMPTAPVV